MFLNLRGFAPSREFHLWETDEVTALSHGRPNSLSNKAVSIVDPPLMDTTPNHPTRLERFQEKLANSRYWSISLALHAVIVAALSTYVLVKTNTEEVPDFTGGETIDVSSLEPFRTVVDNERPNVNIPELQTPNMSQPVPSDTRPSGPNIGKFNGPICILPTSFKIPTGGEDVSTFTSMSLGSVPKELGARFAKNGSNHVVMPTRTGNPPTPNAETENAVLRGLNWLRENQNPDGSWGLRNKGAMTGLALLAFLGHGETGDSKDYGLAVNRAIDWVVNEGTKHENRLSMTDGNWGPGNAGVYEHGILTYALGEYYNLTHDERVTELYRKAVGYVVTGQGPDGGWMYNYDKTQSDTSVSGWQVQALKAAHLTKLDIPGVDGALDRAMANFDRVQGPNGGYGYRTPADRYSLSGVGLSCELFWTGKRDADMRRGVKFILDQTKSEPVNYQHEKADLYAWYYHTQGLLMYGGPAWIEWEAQFRPMAIKSQSADGSWPVMNAVAHGNLQKDPTVTGGVYRTTLAVLMLESYYRYLFLNQATVNSASGTLAVR